MASILTGSSYSRCTRRCTSAVTSIHYSHTSSPSTTKWHPSTPSQPSIPSLKPTITTTQTRNFTSRQSPFEQPKIYEAEFEKLRMRRIKSIVMHPDSTGKDILPGNYVIKVNERTGAERKVILEHEMGYFWALKELERTSNKPIMASESIIPAAEAEKFPTLTGLNCLNDEVVDIPDFFTRNNPTKDATAQCTLVAISCKDFGAQLLPSWIDPFTSQLVNTSDGDKFQTVRITINEGRIAKILSPLIVGGTKKNVPVEDHERTLLYYGNAEEWRDILRMHNIYTGYVYLVDGIGRVRWAGSGGGDDEEVANMIQCAKELVAPVKKVLGAVNSVGPRVGRRVQ